MPEEARRRRGYPDWLGVQVGRATWERSDYFVDGGSDVLENARNPDALPAAKEVLAWLQSSGWQGLAEHACGLRPGDEVIAVIVQHGVTWFVVGYNVFLLGPNGSLLQVGTLERLDHRLGRSRPLLLTRIDPAAWPELHAAAPAFPAVRPEASTAAGVPEAGIRLAKLLHDAVLALRAVPGKLRYVAASNRNPDDDQFMIYAWRAIALDAFHVGHTRINDTNSYNEAILKHGAAAEAVDRALNALEKAKWRTLFAESVVPLASDDPLALLIREDNVWLIAGQTAVFTFDEAGGFELVGACDRIGWGFDTKKAAIHLFDGCSLLPP